MSKWLLYSLPLVFGGLLLFIYTSPLVKITAVHCYLGTAACPPPVLAYLNQQLGAFALFISPSGIERAVYRLVPVAQTVQAKVVLPHTLDLTILPATPWLTLRVKDRSYLIGVNRRVLEIAFESSGSLTRLDTDLPLTFTVGQTIDDQILLSTLSIIDLLATKNITFKTGYLYSENQIHFQLNTGHQAVFTTLTSLSRQVNALQEVLRNATIDSSSTIDVRFTKPVIKPLTIVK